MSPLGSIVVNNPRSRGSGGVSQKDLQLRSIIRSVTNNPEKLDKLKQAIVAVILNKPRQPADEFYSDVMSINKMQLVGFSPTVRSQYTPEFLYLVARVKFLLNDDEKLQDVLITCAKDNFGQQQETPLIENFVSRDYLQRVNYGSNFRGILVLVDGKQVCDPYVAAETKFQTTNDVSRDIRVLTGTEGVFSSSSQDRYAVQYFLDGIPSVNIPSPASKNYSTKLDCMKEALDSMPENLKDNLSTIINALPTTLESNLNSIRDALAYIFDNYIRQTSTDLTLPQKQLLLAVYTVVGDSVKHTQLKWLNKQNNNHVGFFQQLVCPNKSSLVQDAVKELSYDIPEDTSIAGSFQEPSDLQNPADIEQEPDSAQSSPSPSDPAREIAEQLSDKIKTEASISLAPISPTKSVSTAHVLDLDAMKKWAGSTQQELVKVSARSTQQELVEVSAPIDAELKQLEHEIASAKQAPKDLANKILAQHSLQFNQAMVGITKNSRQIYTIVSEQVDGMRQYETKLATEITSLRSNIMTIQVAGYPTEHLLAILKDLQNLQNYYKEQINQYQQFLHLFDKILKLLPAAKTREDLLSCIGMLQTAAGDNSVLKNVATLIVDSAMAVFIALDAYMEQLNVLQQQNSLFKKTKSIQIDGMHITDRHVFNCYLGKQLRLIALKFKPVPDFNLQELSTQQFTNTNPEVKDRFDETKSMLSALYDRCQSISSDRDEKRQTLGEGLSQLDFKTSDPQQSLVNLSRQIVLIFAYVAEVVRVPLQNMHSSANITASTRNSGRLSRNSQHDSTVTNMDAQALDLLSRQLVRHVVKEYCCRAKLYEQILKLGHVDCYPEEKINDIIHHLSYIVSDLLASKPADFWQEFRKLYNLLSILNNVKYNHYTQSVVIPELLEQSNLLNTDAGLRGVVGQVIPQLELGQTGVKETSLLSKVISGDMSQEHQVLDLQTPEINNAVDAKPEPCLSDKVSDKVMDFIVPISAPESPSTYVYNGSFDLLRELLTDPVDANFNYKLNRIIILFLINPDIFAKAEHQALQNLVAKAIIHLQQERSLDFNNARDTYLKHIRELAKQNIGLTMSNLAQSIVKLPREILLADFNEVKEEFARVVDVMRSKSSKFDVLEQYKKVIRVLENAANNCDDYASLLESFASQITFRIAKLRLLKLKNPLDEKQSYLLDILTKIDTYLSGAIQLFKKISLLQVMLDKSAQQLCNFSFWSYALKLNGTDLPDLSNSLLRLKPSNDSTQTQVTPTTIEGLEKRSDSLATPDTDAAALTSDDEIEHHTSQPETSDEMPQKTKVSIITGCP